MSPPWSLPECWLPKPWLDKSPIWNSHLSQSVPWLDFGFFRSHFQIMCWKMLLAAPAHWCWLCLLELVWQSSCSFRCQNMFSLVHFGSGYTDTPTLLTSCGDMLWDYLAVWFKIKQTQMAYTFYSFFPQWKRKTCQHLNTPRNSSKSLLHCEHVNGNRSEP